MSCLTGLQMSLSERGLWLVAVCALLLPSCDFEPVHHSGATSHDFVNTTKVQVAGRQEGFILEHMLRQRLGVVHDADNAYELTVDLDIHRQQGPLLGKDDSRYFLNGSADIVLSDSATGDVLMTDRVLATASWNESDRAIASKAGSDDARERLLIMLAERIHTRMLAYSVGGPA